MEEQKAIELVKSAECELSELFAQIDDVVLFNQKKVLDAFRECEVALRHMQGSSGYGYEDIGRPKLSEVFAKIMRAEDAVVSPLITCVTHAIAACLFGILRPGDLMLAVSGDPYDTLLDCIHGENIGSLKDYGISYDKVEMIGDDFDEHSIMKKLETCNPKLILIQRSRGYSERQALSVEKIAAIIAKIREVNKTACIFVDNCYGEFVQTLEPTEVGADLMAGSLIKNPGGGLAPTGGYVAGKKKYVDLVARRLTTPTLGSEVGSYNASYTPFFQGLFVAPHVVGGALKGSALIGKVAEKLGFKCYPDSSKYPYDIIRNIIFDNPDDLIQMARLVQSYSPIDSNVVPFPWDMPGYTSQVIMAAGTFVQGGSIEFSCDAPIRAPYTLYIQGGITYEHVKLFAIEFVKAKG